VFPQGLRAPKYAAYQEFTAGFERFALHGDNRGSRPYFERAIAIDSTFVQAYLLLARQYLNAGEYDRADSLLRRVDRLPLTLTATERAMEDYHRAELEGNLPNLLRAAQRQARDSAGVPLYIVGEAATFLLQPRLAIRVLQAAESTFAMIGGQATRNHLTVLSTAFHQAGMYDREIQLWRDRGSAFTDRSRLRGLQLVAYAGLQHADAAIALTDSMLRDRTDSSGTSASGVLRGAFEFRAHGDSVTGTRMLTTLSDWYARSPARKPAQPRLLSEGLTLLARGIADSAVTFLTLAALDTNDLDADGFLALAQLARGNRERAKTIADSLGALHRPWLFGRHTYWRAAIMSALGEQELAVQLLKQANGEGVAMDSWHFAFELASLRGYAPFEALIRPQK
jgi:tetratricopeptide (TPR) repeat protein